MPSTSSLNPVEDNEEAKGSMEAGLESTTNLGDKVQSESNEGWIRVGKDKGKSPMQASPSPDEREEPVPKSDAEVMVVTGGSTAENRVPTSNKVNLSPNINLLEKEAQSDALEQMEYQSDSDDVSLEVWDVSGGVEMDDFDSPVAKKNPPGKSSQKSQPSKKSSVNKRKPSNKKASSGKRKNKRSFS
ncbi:hypothetical protein U1Q18_037812 [Sarracenia purpurea var. burkii]